MAACVVGRVRDCIVCVFDERHVAVEGIELWMSPRVSCLVFGESRRYLLVCRERDYAQIDIANFGYHLPLASPEQSGEGLLKRQPTCLRERKYSQLVKDQEKDVPSACLRSVL